MEYEHKTSEIEALKNKITLNKIKTRCKREQFLQTETQIVEEVIQIT